MFGPLLANVVLLVLMSEGGVAASCAPFVGYLQRDGRWEGVLAVTVPESFVPGEDLTVQVSMFVSKKQQVLGASLELSESVVEAETKLRAGGRLTYRVRFPVPDSAPLPRVTAVTANGAPVCQEEGDDIDGTHLNIRNTLQEKKRIPRSPVLEHEVTEVGCGQRMTGSDDKCYDDGAYLLHKDARVWPWMAAVMTGESLLCGGTLISLRHVLTSGSCLFYSNPTKIFTAEELAVTLGVTSANNYKQDTNVQVSKVDEVLVHSRYVYQDLGSNLAILVLATPVTVTPAVRPVCIWPSEPPILSASGVVLNWDSTTNASYVQKVSVVTAEECESGSANLRGVVRNDTICAGRRNGLGFCFYGNAAVKGSGLFTPELKIDGSTRWILRGLFSFQISEQHLDNNNFISCLMDTYNGYIDVTKYAFLIQSKMSELPSSGVTDPLPEFLSHLSVSPDDSHSFVRPGPGLRPGELSTKNQSIELDLKNFDTCGQSTFDDSNRCPNTMSPLTSSTDWPWLAALMYRSDDSEEFTIVASGTLVTTSHVITVASALYTVDDRQGFETKEFSLISVDDDIEARFGTGNLNNIQQNSLFQTKKLKKIVLHPDWIINDVAVLVLQSPILVTPHVQPACAWGASEQLVPGTSGYIVGWDSDTNFARFFDAPTYNLEYCFNIQLHLKNNAGNFTFCAGNRNGLKLFDGGQGAGLFIPEHKPGGAIRWVLGGIFTKENCCSGRFFILYDVQHFKPWIYSVISEQEGCFGCYNPPPPP